MTVTSVGETVVEIEMLRALDPNEFAEYDPENARVLEANVRVLEAYLLPDEVPNDDADPLLFAVMPFVCMITLLSNVCT